MKKGIIGLVVLFTFSFIPAYSATPPSAGSFCSKQGVTKKYLGKKFTCIKFGRKLVWNKGIAIQSSEPVATMPRTPKQLFVPWMTDINQEILVSQANSEFKKWVKQNDANEFIPTYYVDPNLGEVDLAWLKNSTDLAVKSFGRDSPTSYSVFVGKDCEWIRVVGNASCTESMNNQYFSNSISSSYFVLNSVSDRNWLRPSDLQTAAHEYFHSVQAKLSNGANWSERTTSWFIEGGAYFIGISFSDLAGVSPYIQGRDEELLQRGYQTKRYLPLEKYTYQNVNPPLNYENPYGIGCVATEYIVASVGMQKYLDIYRNLGLGKDFNSAFETAAGLSLSDFYARFEIIRDRVGMPRGQ